MKNLKRILSIALLALAACAKVGDPLPPLVRTPEKVTGVTVRQTGYTVILSWTNPRAHTDGSPLTDLAILNVFQNGTVRRPVPANGPGVVQAVTIPVNDVVGKPQTFFVVAETKRGRTSAQSDPTAIDVVEVPGPVNKLFASLDQHRIRVTWEPPADRRELVSGYSVRRSGGGVDTVVTESPFEDSNYVKDQTYEYHVTPIRLDKSRLPIPGPAEQIYSVKAVDKTKPATPATLPVTILGENPVRALITWKPNSEKDFVGYRVYKGPGKDGPFTVLADKLETTAFPDPMYMPGTVYAVTALDDSGNESEQSIPAIAP